MGRFVVFSRCNTSRCGSNVKVVKWHSSSTGSISFVTVKGKKTTMCNSLGGRCTYSSLSSLKKTTKFFFFFLLASCVLYLTVSNGLICVRQSSRVGKTLQVIFTKPINLFKEFYNVHCHHTIPIEGQHGRSITERRRRKKKCCKKPTGGVYKRSGSPPR